MIFAISPLFNKQNRHVFTYPFRNHLGFLFLCCSLISPIANHLVAQPTSIPTPPSLVTQADSGKTGDVLKRLRLRPKVDISVLNRYLSPFIYQVNRNKPYSPAGVKVHPLLLQYRKEMYDSTTYDPTRIQDNPVFHNSVQLMLHSRWEITRGVSFDANLQLEQQGHSFGPYNAARTFFQPQMRLEIDRDLIFFKQDFNFRGAVGTFRNFRLNEGLFIYGLDVQGLDLSLAWKRLRLRYVQINDLQAGIGLNMQEVYFINLQLDSLPLGSRWKADMGAALFATNSLFGPSLKLGFQHGENLRLYAEAGTNMNVPEGLRLYVPRNSMLDQLGLVAGVKWKRESDLLETNLRAEFRYYGNEFLFFRKWEGFGYSGGRAELQSLFSGQKPRNHYYPLHYSDRPFAQFGLFTDFYNNGPSLNNLSPDVGAITLNANVKLNLRHQLFLRAILDFNLIFTEYSEPYLYPFYRVSFGWQPHPGNRLSIGLTNKSMDYQLHYPTHQLLTRPFFALNATRDLPNWQRNDWR